MTHATDLLPDKNKPLIEHSELQLLAMVLFGEARGEPIAARRGIADAIINRALQPRWWGRNLKQVILKPWQFSSFNGPEVIKGIRPKQIDPNYVKLREPLQHESKAVWEACCETAVEAYERLHDLQLPDSVKGANHYFDTSIKAPAWADPAKFVVALSGARAGHQVKFYRL